MNVFTPMRVGLGLPLYAHSVDPPGLYRLAGDMGKAVARGLLNLNAAQSILVQKAVCAAPSYPEWSAYCCRLKWALRDTAHQYAIDRERATSRVRWAVQPMFARRAPSAVIMAEAELISGHFLRRHELVEVCRRVASEVLSGRTQRGHHGGR